MLIIDKEQIINNKKQPKNSPESILKDIKKATSFNFLISEKQDSVEYLSNQTNPHHHTLSPRRQAPELFWPNSKNIRFNQKLKKQVNKPLTSKALLFNKELLQQNISSSNRGPSFVQHHRFAIKPHSKTSYAKNFGYSKLPNQNTLNLLPQKKKQSQLLSPSAKSQFLKIMNKVSSINSSPELKSKNRKRSERLLFDRENNKNKDESIDNFYDTFFIERKKLGERGFGMGKLASKFTITDREDIAIINKFQKTVRQNRQFMNLRRQPSKLVEFSQDQIVRNSPHTAQSKQTNILHIGQISSKRNRSTSINSIQPWQNTHTNPEAQHNLPK